MQQLIVILLIILQTMLWNSFALADIFNPVSDPAHGDFILPMPDNAAMVFRPVFIGEGSKSYTLREFKVGDSSAGFKEYPTKVAVGGSFIANNPQGHPDWLYYMGKYEVTEAQYYSIMEPGTKSDSQKPISNISWFKAQEFINKYNIWLFKNALNKMPKNQETCGFLRLPTEVEWEFAARGGSVAEADQFTDQYPYPSGQLTKYEWFSGPRSSHGKVKDIGLLKANDLKIHDMLGNVSEMTKSLYRIEYYQGRTGGFVARGGSFRTSQNKIRSSLRMEIPYYKEIKGVVSPSRQQKLGLRLVISSPIYTSLNFSRQLADEWDAYKQSSSPPALPGHGGSSIVAQTNVQLSDALQSLQILRSELQNAPSTSQTAMNQLGILEASFQNVESVVNKAEIDSAYAWIKIANETASFIVNRDMPKLPGKIKALKIAKELGKSDLVDQFKKQVKGYEKNIHESMQNYGFCFEQLDRIQESVVLQAFDKYREYLVRKNAYKQLKMIAIVKKHYKEYLTNHHLNTGKWKTDLEKF